MITIRRSLKYFINWCLLPILFYSNHAHAQKGIAELVVNKLEDFNKATLQEKIYLHTDKNFYVAGELLWFKVYYVDGWFHQPLQVSKILYVDLLDKQNNSVLRTMISLKPGEDNGSLQLPLSLNSGSYRIRGYTSWMKNFSPEFFFEKQLVIVNPLKARDSVSAMPVQNISVDFLPEGGHLVRGLESRVGFVIRDSYGKGVNARGFVMIKGGDTVVRFHPLKFGLGNFLFTPNAGEVYEAGVIRSDGTVIRKDLPPIDQKGYAMKLTDEGTGGLRIILNNNGNDQDDELLLLVHTRQVLKLAMKARLQGGHTEFQVDKSKLGSGISEFTIFSDAGQPICERLFFKQPDSNIVIKTSGNKETYTSREKVDLQLNTFLNNQYEPAQLSVAVFRSDSLQDENHMDIQNYLWLTSDLTGYIESPDFYFSDDPQVSEAADNLMLVHGWRRFNWQLMLKDSQPGYTFPPESNGHIINAKITEKNSGRPAQNVPAFLSVPFSPSFLFNSSSDYRGLVHFDVKNYYGAGEIVAQANDKSGIYRVDINSAYSDAFANRPLTNINLSPQDAHKLEEYSIGMQTEHIYSSDQINQFRRPLFTDTLPFYGRPEAVYYLDDYTRFTTMEEVLREYVREISVFTRNGKMKIKILNVEKKEFFEDNMLVMLDGIPLSDPDKILQLDPLKIRKVELIPRAYIYGPSIFTGLASFTSYKNNFDAVELDPSLIRIDYEGIQMNRIFYAPVYETTQQKTNRKPDFRNTLFWSPDVRTDAKGLTRLQFYTSDQKGKYRVVIQGLDMRGHTAVSSFSFSVN
ncbi:MAG: hypothetical protein ACJ75B_01885 [Flavisolibacter sp.]